MELCKCGHHKDTHFESKHTCLGTLCSCERYRDKDAPERKEALKMSVEVSFDPESWTWPSFEVPAEVCIPGWKPSV